MIPKEVPKISIEHPIVRVISHQWEIEPPSLAIQKIRIREASLEVIEQSSLASHFGSFSPVKAYSIGI